MSRNLQAIYEKGVLRPLEPVELKEHQQVRVTIFEGETLEGCAPNELAEFERKLDELSEGLPPLSTLPPEFSRADIYDNIRL
jgi:predicted DNA-binding antitoxin AbrB/MazE fold protein